MFTFILKRLLSGIVLLFVVASGTFFLAHAAIPNPALGLHSSGATPEAIEALTVKIGADRPGLVRYHEWLLQILQGNFGVSWKNNQSVAKILGIRFPVTFSLVIASVCLSAVLSAVLGIAAGLRPFIWIDKTVKAGSVVLFALPGFWVAVVLVMTFAVQIKWFPAIGYTPIGRRDVPGPPRRGWQWRRSHAHPRAFIQPAAVGGVPRCEPCSAGKAP